MANEINTFDADKLQSIVKEAKEKRSKRKGLNFIAIALIIAFICIVAVGAVFLYLATLETQIETPGPKPGCPEEFECCRDNEYQDKYCPAYQECENHRCEIQLCPRECCIYGRYVWKDCANGLVCERFECVNPECQEECCNEGSNYRLKECGKNQLCEENKCVEKPIEDCTKECCLEEEGFTDKPCSGQLVCINNKCEKKECPALCCPQNNPEYLEKKCPPHQKCVGKVCVGRF